MESFLTAITCTFLYMCLLISLKKKPRMPLPWIMWLDTAVELASPPFNVSHAHGHIHGLL